MVGKHRSLTRNVVVYSSLWAAMAIFILGWVLVGLYKSSIDRSFDDLQLAQLYSLIASVDVEDEELGGSPDLGDSNFRTPLSGWYWQVSFLEEDKAIFSPSLSGGAFERPSLQEIPYAADFSRRYITDGPDGNPIRVLETEIELAPGRVALFQVSGDEAGFRRTISDYTRQIAGLLGTFALGMVIINALIILFGLRPLEKLRKALGDIRDGKAEKLAGSYPSEVQPLADELNLMIDNNRRILDRARMQVGNLAHSLKTPIAVLQNAAGQKSPLDPKMVAEQSGAMKDQVQHYLDRARIAAQRETLMYRTDVIGVSEKLVRVMAKINPEKSVSMKAANDRLIFAGEKEDLEEIIGNLLENACKWAKNDVQLQLSLGAGDDNAKPNVVIMVCDDGPGISPDMRAQAMRRGGRIDEAKPGSGLGLSIVLEAVKSYGGQLTLGDSQAGGLAVSVTLPGLRE